MLDVVTLGEAMVVFTPLQPGPLRFAPLFTKSVAGAEANVAIAVTRMGLRAGFIGRVGDDELGKYVLTFLRGEGLDVSGMVVDRGAPTAIYLKECRTPSHVRVYYYRRGSAGSRLSPPDVDEHYVRQARALYVSGITSALGANCHAAVRKAIEVASAAGLTVYFDPNYRATLWSKQQARQAWMELLPMCDVVVTSPDEASILVGEAQPDEVSVRLLELGLQRVVVKAGLEGIWVAQRDFVQHIPLPRHGHTIDPVGAGDAVVGGVIAGELRGLDLPRAAKLGALLASYAVEAVGDTEGIPTFDELEAALNTAPDVVR